MLPQSRVSSLQNHVYQTCWLNLELNGHNVNDENIGNDENAAEYGNQSSQVMFAPPPAPQQQQQCQDQQQQQQQQQHCQDQVALELKCGETGDVRWRPA